MPTTWERRLATKLQTAKLYTVVVPLDRQAIADAIRNALNMTGELASSHYHKLNFLEADWWSWERDAKVVDPDYLEPQRDPLCYASKHALYSGRIVKRLRKALLVRAGLNLCDGMASELAQLTENWLGQQGEFAFDFVKTIDWERGDFGEAGACFWGDHAEAKDMLMSDPTFLAMRFYAASDADERYYGSGKGVGRAWIVQRTIDGVLCPILFNGYWAAGANHTMNHDYGGGSNCTKMAGMVLRAHLKGGSALIDLCNNDTPNGMLWINNGCGIVLHPRDSGEFRKIARVDLEITEQTHYVCCYCDRPANPDLYIMQDNDDSSYYCQYCWDIYTADCIACDGRYDTTNGYRHDGYFYCKSCYDEWFWFCAECGNTYDREEEPPYSHYTCPSCIAVRRTRCACCLGSLTKTPDEKAYRIKTFQTESDMLDEIPEDMVRWTYYCKTCAESLTPPLVHCPACDTYRFSTRAYTDSYNNRKCGRCHGTIRPQATECNYCNRYLLLNGQSTEVLCKNCEV